MIWVAVGVAVAASVWAATSPRRQAKNEAYGMALHRRNRAEIERAGHTGCGGQPTCRYSGAGQLIEVGSCTCGRPVKRTPAARP